MTHAGGLNLIRVFDFYLAVMLLFSVLRRYEQYRAIGAIVVSAPARWPKLLGAMKQHRGLFLTWATIRPAALTLGLMVAQTICSRVIWPTAQLTLGHLFDHWLPLPVVLATLAAMLAVDAYFLLRVGRIDQEETAKYLDQAEHWLTSWKAPVVRIITFGFVDPRAMVHDELEKAMTGLSETLNRSLWWMSAQVAARVAFGLSLWCTWALYAR